MRLDKYLADMTGISRLEIKKLIKKRNVKVNDIVIKTNDYKVKEDDVVCLNDQQIKYQEFEYYILNKPAGYLSATEDKYDKTIMELIDPKRKDLVPVGRLDKDSEGLILLTNDGKLNHYLLSPKNHVSKKYYVEVENVLPDNAKEQFSKPMKFEDFTASPAEYEQIDDTHAYLTIHEGKFHQVKRMFEKIGCPVIYLKRVEFAFLNLEGVPTGEYRELTQEEIEQLKTY